MQNSKATLAHALLLFPAGTRMMKTERHAPKAPASTGPALSVIGLAMVLPPTVAVLYLAKSALGINLMPGPSPLHDLLYHLTH